MHMGLIHVHSGSKQHHHSPPGGTEGGWGSARGLMLAGRSACVSMGAAGTMLGGQERHLPVCTLIAPSVAYALVDTPHLECTFSTDCIPGMYR